VSLDSASKAIFGRRLPNFNIADHWGLGLQLLMVSAPMGMVVGAAIAGYDWIVNTLIWERLSEHLSPGVLCLMPVVAMMLTYAIVALGRVVYTSMADEVVRAYHSPKHGLDYRRAGAKLAASVATMGFGGSAGMEGASKWLGAVIGGAVQSLINRVGRLKLLHAREEVTMLAGAAAGISAIFRAPLTGAIMGIESPYKHDLAHEALLHGLVAAATSYVTFTALGTATPYFPIKVSYVLNWRDLLVCIPLGLTAGLASHLFLGLLSRIKAATKDSSRPKWLHYLVGGIVLSFLAGLTYVTTGEPLTLQAGLPVARRLLYGNYPLLVCLVIFVTKLIATAVTFGCGGVGGLFVPSATIGAALGAMFDVLFPTSQPGLYTMVGVAAFTGASYNSLLFAAVFVAEATGSPAMVVPGLIASCIAFVTSAGVSNSSHQRHHR